MTAIWFCPNCGGLGTFRYDRTYKCKRCKTIWFRVKPLVSNQGG